MTTQAIRGKRIEQPVELRDFLPTFIELAGGTVPDDMDGKSLVALPQEIKTAGENISIWNMPPATVPITIGVR